MQSSATVGSGLLCCAVARISRKKQENKHCLENDIYLLQLYQHLFIPWSSFSYILLDQLHTFVISYRILRSALKLSKIRQRLYTTLLLFLDNFLKFDLKGSFYILPRLENLP